VDDAIQPLHFDWAILSLRVSPSPQPGGYAESLSSSWSCTSTAPGGSGLRAPPMRQAGPAPYLFRLKDAPLHPFEFRDVLTTMPAAPEARTRARWSRAGFRRRMAIRTRSVMPAGLLCTPLPAPAPAPRAPQTGHGRAPRPRPVRPAHQTDGRAVRHDGAPVCVEGHHAFVRAPGSMRCSRQRHAFPPSACRLYPRPGHLQAARKRKHR